MDANRRVRKKINFKLSFNLNLIMIMWLLKSLRNYASEELLIYIIYRYFILRM